MIELKKRSITVLTDDEVKLVSGGGFSMSFVCNSDNCGSFICISNFDCGSFVCMSDGCDNSFICMSDGCDSNICNSNDCFSHGCMSEGNGCI